MGNLQCSVENAAHLVPIARDICPFPDYSPNPHIFTTLSLNSSLHMKNHYAAVQSSLTPQQLDDFTQNLRTTFGRHGRVTDGGIGVVALSLALLFDTIARKVKGGWESETEPIPGLFLRDFSGSYPPQVYTISKYLRLVPHIANNPTRMMEETKRYIKKLMIDQSSPGKFNRQNSLKGDDITGANSMFIQALEIHLHAHLARLTNSTLVEVAEAVEAELHPKGRPDSSRNSTKTEDDAARHSKSRQKHSSSPENSVIFHLNCDLEEARKEFLAEMAKSDSRTQAAFQDCQRYVTKTWMNFIAQVAWFSAVNRPVHYEFQEKHQEIIALREDFDLKANALGKWL